MFPLRFFQRAREELHTPDHHESDLQSNISFRSDHYAQPSPDSATYATLDNNHEQMSKSL